MKFEAKSITYFTFFLFMFIKWSLFQYCWRLFFDAVAISPVTGQGVKNTK